jgi:hypothetical protein
LDSIRQAPVTKFWINLLFYSASLVFLVLVALSKFKYDDDGHARWLTSEKCLASLMIVFGIEEIGQFLSAANSSRGIATWSESVWNKMDTAGLASYLAFVLCRENGKPIWARIFISMNALPAMFRLLQVSGLQVQPVHTVL